MIEIVAAAAGILTGLITALSTLSKVQAVLSRLESRDVELREQLERHSDRTELLFNGLKERIEHINTRLTSQLKETSTTVLDVEAFLQKRTEYERRAR